MLRSCPRCTRAAAAHVRFCEYCGSPVSDNTTRYLCVAVHRDSAYCDAAIAEFLVEPVRALPPSAGADSADVLRDAVAAHTRRRVRDAGLLVLLLVFAIANFALFATWLAIALVGWFATGASKHRSSGTSGRTAIVIAVVVVGLYLLGDSLLLALGLSPAYLAYELSQLSSGAADSGMSTTTVLVTILMIAVVFGDAYLVHWLVHTWFRRDRFITDPRHRATPPRTRSRSVCARSAPAATPGNWTGWRPRTARGTSRHERTSSYTATSARSWARGSSSSPTRCRSPWSRTRTGEAPLRSTWSRCTDRSAAP
jgi:hypothetical protein